LSKAAKSKGFIFIISGPSGSGKTTILNGLLKDKSLKKRLVKSISFTTRPRRSNERDRKDYFFLNRREFLSRLKEKKILEWTRYLGYYYGTPKELVETQLAAAKSVLLCLDLKGASRIRQLYPEVTVRIFIMPPSLHELPLRIEKRCQQTKKEEVFKRIKLARREVRASKAYDHCLINDKLDNAIKALKDIVLRYVKRPNKGRT
jgi:guanylate kinase